jgi:RimJ/RimL family protein N-acetyltransferase
LRQAGPPTTCAATPPPKRSWAAFLVHAADVGLRELEITCDADNPASRKVIERNGAHFVEAFRAPPALGGHQTLRFRIRVAEQTSR